MKEETHEDKSPVSPSSAAGGGAVQKKRRWGTARPEWKILGAVPKSVGSFQYRKKTKPALKPAADCCHSAEAAEHETSSSSYSCYSSYYSDESVASRRKNTDGATS